MINTNYSDITALAQKKGEPNVDFDSKNYSVKAITAEKDTFTLSDEAVAKMNGEQVEQIAPTYIKPETARELLAESAKTSGNKSVEESESDNRFKEVMQNILDQRIGIDRKKLEEIEAMKEEIANNENLSPEEKKKAIEELDKLKEKIIEESLDIRKQAKQTFVKEEVS